MELKTVHQSILDNARTAILAGHQTAPYALFEYGDKVHQFECPWSFDVEGKNMFVTACTMMAIHLRASRVTVVSEAWMKGARVGSADEEVLRRMMAEGRSIQELSETREVLMMYSQTRENVVHNIVEIIRTADGVDFVPMDNSYEGMASRFDGIMPPVSAMDDEAVRKHCRDTLTKIDNNLPM